jgi:prepilin-type N-terminal cleavage/methylation domain-containing protein
MLIRSKNLSGFTLIEMIAVLAIIIIIAGAIVVAAGGLWGHGQQKGTEATLQGIMAALDTYANQNQGYYPPDNQGPVAPDAVADPNYRIKNLTYALDKAGLLKKAVTGNFIAGDTQVPHNYTVNGIKIEVDRMIVDAWRRPFSYYCPPIALLADDGSSKMPVGVSYELYSLGEDGQYGPFPAPTGPNDDIKNWREMQ